MTDFLKIAKSIAVHFAHICAYGVETEVYSKLKDPFKDLHSTYLQEKCFTESFGCIVSFFVVVIVI